MMFKRCVITQGWLFTWVKESDVQDRNLFNCCINIFSHIYTNCESHKILGFFLQILQKPKVAGLKPAYTQIPKFNDQTLSNWIKKSYQSLYKDTWYVKRLKKSPRYRFFSQLQPNICNFGSKHDLSPTHPTRHSQRATNIMSNVGSKFDWIGLA